MTHVRMALPTPAPSARHHLRWRVLLSLGGALLLAGCASSRVDRLSVASSPAISAPSSVTVSVTLSPDLQSNRAARNAADVLQAKLIKYYGEAGLPAFASGSGPATATAALVRVRIDHADPGDRAARLLIGFGAGRSALETDVTIEIDGQTAPAMTFSASAKSGRKPGLVVPGSIVAATGKVYRLAIGAGAVLLGEAGSDLNDDAARSARLIVKQTRHLYRSSGWVWPSGKADAG